MKLPVPTKREAIILSTVESCSALLRMLLEYICKR